MAEYYRKGAPPFHVDHCSAFDHYFQAAKLGDTDAQLKVADMFITGIGGYRDFEFAYGWAKYAKKHGNKNADFVLDRTDIKSIPESVRSLLDRQLSVWTPKDSGLAKTYRIPLVPGIWSVLQFFIPLRDCDDPTVWDHMFGD